MPVVMEYPPSLATSGPTKTTAMVVMPDPRARASVTRHLWMLGIRDVVEVSTVAEARIRLATPRNLCVVDANLPDGSGPALLKYMQSAGWTGGLVLSARDDIQTVRAALAAGSRGYVITGTRGRSPVGSRVVSSPPSFPPQNSVNRVRGLSSREIEVLRLVADGQTNKAIGESMGLSALTVKSHLARIARKLGTGDRAGMVGLALRTGILT